MKRLSTLAPAGGFSSPWQLFLTYRLYHLNRPALGGCADGSGGGSSRASEQLAVLLKVLAQNPEVHFRSSGKAALFSLLAALRKQTKKHIILVSAYTCPDVVAAILKAGFKCHLLDVDSTTLEVKTSNLSPSLEREAAGVILSNLYGLPDALEPWRAIQDREEDFLIIDDACQAFQSFCQGERVGARNGTVGILSFGRGKSIGAAGGGAILLSGDLRAHLSRHLREEVLLPLGPLQSLKSLVLAQLAWLLEFPLLYTLPASLPFLGLGETHCQADFPVRELSRLQSWVALAQLGNQAVDTLMRRQRREYFEEHMRDFSTVRLPSLSRQKGCELLRLPVVFHSQELCKNQLKRLADSGLGANGSYPRTIDAYPEFETQVTFNDLSEARILAERILTLPLHRHVNQSAAEQIVQIIQTGSMTEH